MPLLLEVVARLRTKSYHRERHGGNQGGNATKTTTWPVPREHDRKRKVEPSSVGNLFVSNLVSNVVEYTCYHEYNRCRQNQLGGNELSKSPRANIIKIRVQRGAVNVLG